MVILTVDQFTIYPQDSKKRGTMNNHTVSIEALSQKELLDALERRYEQNTTQDTHTEQKSQCGAITEIENAIELIETVTSPKEMLKKGIFKALRFWRDVK